DENLGLAATLETAIKIEPSERFRNAEGFSSTLRVLQKLRRIRKAMPKGGGVIAWAKEHPIIALISAVFWPNLIGSVVQITYNQLLIIRHLTQIQQRLFLEMVFIYNPIAYVIGTVILLGQLRPFLLFLWQHRSSQPRSVGDFKYLRDKVMSFPGWVVSVL